MAGNDCRAGSRTCWNFFRRTLFYLSEPDCHTRGTPGERQGSEFRCQHLFPSPSLLRFIRGGYLTACLDYSDRFPTAQEQAPCRHLIDLYRLPVEGVPHRTPPRLSVWPTMGGA